MKRIIAACSLVLCFAACNQPPAKPPTVVMEDMFTAMKKGDINDMKKFITKSDVAMLEAAEKFMTNLDPEGIQKIKNRMTEELKENAKHIEYSLKNEKIDGDHATVEAEIITKDTAAVNGKKITNQSSDNAARSKTGDQSAGTPPGIPAESSACLRPQQARRTYS